MTLRATAVVPGLRYSVDDDTLSRAGWSLWYIVQRRNVEDAWEITDVRHREVRNDGRLGRRVLAAVARLDIAL